MRPCRLSEQERLAAVCCPPHSPTGHCGNPDPYATARDTRGVRSSGVRLRAEARRFPCARVCDGPSGRARLAQWAALQILAPARGGNRARRESGECRPRRRDLLPAIGRTAELPCPDVPPHVAVVLCV